MLVLAKRAVEGNGQQLLFDVAGSKPLSHDMGTRT